MGCPSFQESLIIIAVLALVFGATRLPQLGDALGRSIRNFKRAMKGENEIDVTASAKRLPDEAPKKDDEKP